MKWKMLFLVFALSSMGSCRPMIGPVILNATANTIEFEARFGDGHEMKEMLEPTNLFWLSHDEAPLTSLRVTGNGREIAALDSQVLRSWQTETSRKNPLVVEVYDAKADRLPYAFLPAEAQRLKDEMARSAQRK